MSDLTQLEREISRRRFLAMGGPRRGAIGFTEMILRLGRTSRKALNTYTLS